MKKLIELRKSKKLSQTTLAKDLKIAQNTLSQYETGKREPDFETLQKIAKYFNVTVDYLLDDSQQSSSYPVPSENYVHILGRNGVKTKIAIPPEKVDRFKKLLEAGMPDLFQDDDLDL